MNVDKGLWCFFTYGWLFFSLLCSLEYTLLKYTPPDKPMVSIEILLTG
jgi:hypothetical protein